jgi:Putative restriction endonuclease
MEAANMTALPNTSRLPTHLDLPEKDNSVVENHFEMPQGMLLSESIVPVLEKVHPDGQCAYAGNSLIYFRYTKENPLRGCRAPDWFYVPGVAPRAADGQFRRSYVLWQEHVPPLILLEFASGDGSPERDATPQKGKFWIYEREIRPRYYGIYVFLEGVFEMYHLENGRFQRAAPNRRGRYPIPELGVELGLWRGDYAMQGEALWLRWFDGKGRLLLTGHETAERERQRTERQKQQMKKQKKVAGEQEKRADQEKLRADQLAAKLREMGVDPDAM